MTPILYTVLTSVAILIWLVSIAHLMESAQFLVKKEAAFDPGRAAAAALWTIAWLLAGIMALMLRPIWL